MSEQDAPEDEQAADSEAAAGDADGEATAGDAAGEAADAADEEPPAAEDDPAAGTSEEPQASADDEGETADGDESAGEDEIDGDLVERVREADAEELAREIAALRDRADDLEAELDEREAERDELEAERDELESKLKRKQADFQNFKKRQEQKREEAERRATEDLVERLLDVRDNLDRALEQEEGVDVRDGVETTKRQFDRVLEAENVEPIDPEPGAEVDPQRHEVLMRVESDREPGTVDEVHRPGYEMAGKVLRPAQVTVAEDE